MPIMRLNHAVLYVRDIDRSVTFYCEILRFRQVAGIAGRAAFLQAEGSTNDHDLGLFALGDGAGASTAGRSTVGLYHLAWEVDTLDELERMLTDLAGAGALVGMSDHGTTKALYAVDPDGLEFEVSWLVPAALLTDDLQMMTAPLDLASAIARYGRHTQGGIGISRHPAP